ncbi:hypothetical protein [uncultured Marinobacter sp.]|uniref:hypothetical protein n=1 Tax=uncultured Marinobacter sp. TaxID=187379 RepID=UPI0030D6E4EC
MADPRAALHHSLQDLLTRHVHQRDMVEIVFRDPSGQIQTLHSRIRDLFVRPGGNFIALECGQLVPADHVILLNGYPLTAY